ncbi:coiled-coil domain-containing protein [Helicobacter kayseriensis]|uniref:coiled-coil domain-containing protein n=1 Tax=Helicobacter kayseriensis TaxID=2905877 RepID=UPI001E5787CA|nr:coiled-coil domain-containing protein [Helicobacter kayseriensis]MCE3046805.1 coiled-coil domain-containing protein [Helicobacter kayseriensis]MCE3047893.1 coiled-coil domain-containing protein [Helicobacter kayseriensis]
MKAFFKLLFALCISAGWYAITHQEGISVIFFFIVCFALFVRPSKTHQSAIRDQYIEKLKENIKKNQEVSEQFSKEKNITYKDFRKKERL